MVNKRAWTEINDDDDQTKHERKETRYKAYEMIGTIRDGQTKEGNERKGMKR